VTRVLGIDPGSSATGWALVVATGNRSRLDAAGVIRPRGADRPVRLADLGARLDERIVSLNPDVAAVELAFSGRNPRSGLALAEARGVILATLGRHGLPVRGLTPAAVKSAVVGNGRAEKQQVVFMVVRLLGLTEPPARDAADAIAVALSYLHGVGSSLAALS
jgi:crossover junction endodeoxyribonuclease RuvC